MGWKSIKRLQKSRVGCVCKELHSAAYTKPKGKRRRPDVKLLLSYYKFSPDPSPDLCSVSTLSVARRCVGLVLLTLWAYAPPAHWQRLKGARFDLGASSNQHQLRVHEEVGEVIWSSHSKTERCMTAVDRHRLNVSKGSCSTRQGGQI